LRLIDSCITQIKAHGPSRTCNESKEEEEVSQRQPRHAHVTDRFRATRQQLKRVQHFCLKAKARIWPCLSYMCHILSTAERGSYFFQNRRAHSGRKSESKQFFLSQRASDFSSHENSSARSLTKVRERATFLPAITSVVPMLYQTTHESHPFVPGRTRVVSISYQAARGESRPGFFRRWGCSRSVRLNLASSLFVLNQDLQYRLTVHLPLNRLNEETNLSRTAGTCRRQATTFSRPASSSSSLLLSSLELSDAKVYAP